MLGLSGLFGLNTYDPALQEVETAIQQDPQSGKIRFWKARILLYQGREELAMKEAEKCVTLSPAMPGGRNLLLRIYRKLGKEKEAAEQAAWLRQHEDRVAMGRGR